MSKVAVIAVIGGLLGILMMIPLRRALIVKEHGNLTYPEGTACAEVLVAGDKGGLQARLLFQAFGIAFLYKFLMAGLHLWKEYPGRISDFYKNASISGDAGLGGRRTSVVGNALLLHLHLSASQWEERKRRHGTAVFAEAELSRVDDRKADLIRRLVSGCAIVLDLGDYALTLEVLITFSDTTYPCSITEDLKTVYHDVNATVTVPELIIVLPRRSTIGPQQRYQ